MCAWAALLWIARATPPFRGKKAAKAVTYFSNTTRKRRPDERAVACAIYAEAVGEGARLPCRRLPSCVKMRFSAINVRRWGGIGLLLDKAGYDMLNRKAGRHRSRKRRRNRPQGGRRAGCLQPAPQEGFTAHLVERRGCGGTEARTERSVIPLAYAMHGRQGIPGSHPIFFAKEPCV